MDEAEEPWPSLPPGWAPVTAELLLAPSSTPASSILWDPNEDLASGVLPLQKTPEASSPHG